MADSLGNVTLTGTHLDSVTLNLVLLDVVLIVGVLGVDVAANDGLVSLAVNGHLPLLLLGLLRLNFSAIHRNFAFSSIQTMCLCLLLK